MRFYSVCKFVCNVLVMTLLKHVFIPLWFCLFFVSFIVCFLRFQKVTLQYYILNEIVASVG